MKSSVLIVCGLGMNEIFIVYEISNAERKMHGFSVSHFMIYIYFTLEDFCGPRLIGMTFVSVAFRMTPESIQGSVCPNQDRRN